MAGCDRCCRRGRRPPCCRAMMFHAWAPWLLATSAAVAPGPPGGWQGTEAHLRGLERRVAAELAEVTALPLLHERQRWRDEDVRPQRWRAQVASMAVNPRAAPLVRDHAAWLGMQDAVDREAWAELPAWRQRSGVVSAYMVVGPFENTGGAAFSAALPPQQDPLPERHYDGLSRTVGWRTVDDVGPRGALMLHDHVWPSDDVLAYAQVALDAAADHDVALRVGASDQLAVYVNGVEVLNADEVHRWAPDQHVVGVRLHKGLNHVLFKIGQVRGGWALVTRITELQGGPAAGVTSRADASSITAALALLGQGKPSVASEPLAALDPLAVLQRRAEQAGPEQWQAWWDLVLLRQALANDDARTQPTATVKLLDQLLAKTPTNPTVLTARAQARLADDINGARVDLEAALAADPRHAPAWFMLGQLRCRQDLPVACRQALLRAASTDPRFTRAAVALWEETAAQSADTITPVLKMRLVSKRYPTAAATEGLLRLEQNRGMFVAALKTARKLRVLHPGHPVARAVVVQAAQADNDRKALLTELQAAARADPHDGHDAVALALAQLDAGDMTNAVAGLEVFCAAHPDDVHAWTRLADLRLRAKDAAAAQHALEHVLRIRPQEPGVRRHLAALTGGGDGFEQRHKLDLATLRGQPLPPGAAEAGAYALGQVVAHRLYENGLTTELIDVAYMLLDAAKAPLIQELDAAYVPARETLEVLRAERLMPDGTVLPAEVSEQDPTGRQMGVYTDQRRVRVVFGALQPGDVVHLRYRRDAIGDRNLFGDYYGTVEYAQEAVPKALYTLVVEAPEGRPLHHAVVGLPAPKVTNANHTLTYMVSAANLAALPMEQAMPPYTEIGAYAMFSSYGTWEDMGRWYHGLIKDQLVADAPVKKAAQDLVEGVTDVREKVRRIHRYVLSHTRYVGIELGIHGWKPYRVSQVLSRGYGDCKDKASLLVVMLKHVGVDARLVLTRTYDQGPMADLPSMWSFNHAIAYVPQLDLYLDGTAEFSGMAELPWMDQQAMVLQLAVDSGAVKRSSPALAPAAENFNRSNYTIQLLANGSASLAGAEVFGGQRAPDERMKLQDPGTQQSRLQREFTLLYPGAAVSDVTVTDVMDLDHPLTYTFKATVPAFGQTDGELVTLPVSLYPHELEREYAPTPRRRTDVVLNFPFHTRNVMRFVLPAGATIRELPQGIVLDTPNFEFRQEIRRQPDGYTVDELAHFKTRRIPVADYAALRNAVLEADRRMRARVVVVMPKGNASGAPTVVTGRQP